MSIIDEGINLELYKAFQGWLTAGCKTFIFILYIILWGKMSSFLV